jgi:hypothetical protein
VGPLCPAVFASLAVILGTPTRMSKSGCLRPPLAFAFASFVIWRLRIFLEARLVRGGGGGGGHQHSRNYPNCPMSSRRRAPETKILRTIGVAWGVRGLPDAMACTDWVWRGSRSPIIFVSCIHRHDQLGSKRSYLMVGSRSVSPFVQHTRQWLSAPPQISMPVQLEMTRVFVLQIYNRKPSNL